MNRRELERLDCHLTNFVDGLTDGLGRSERRAALFCYVSGLLLDGERKSIYPMAQRLVTKAAQVESMRQSMQQAISVATWCDIKVQSRLASKIDRELPGIEVLVVDDTGFPKKGELSVGVSRQYSGTMGRTANCQIAVSLHLAGENRSACGFMRLYLPQHWASDSERRATVGVPVDVEFQTKWQISLDQVDHAMRAGVRKHVVLADAAYGDCTEYRKGITDRGLPYLLTVSGTHVVWREGSNPRLAKRVLKEDIRNTYQDPNQPPAKLQELAGQLEFETVTWRDGSYGKQSSRFAATRVRSAHRHVNGCPPGSEEWLLCEWPKDKDQPTKFWLSTLPSSTTIKTLVRLAKLRWRIERDYQELKEELGLDHFEGRSWRGFHHHVTMCAVAHAFLALQRALFPPEDEELDSSCGQKTSPNRHSNANRPLPALSQAYSSA